MGGRSVGRGAESRAQVWPINYGLSTDPIRWEAGGHWHAGMMGGRGTLARRHDGRQGDTGTQA